MYPENPTLLHTPILHFAPFILHYSGNGNTRETAALITFGSNDLVVISGTQVHAQIPPGIKVASGTNTTTDGPSWVLLGVTDRPELLEGLSTIDRWCIETRGGQNVVVSAVTVYRSSPRGSGGWIVRTVGFNDVVLYEGVQCPAVDRKVTIPVRLESTTVIDHSDSSKPSKRLGKVIILPAIGAWVPSFSTDDITIVT